MKSQYGRYCDAMDAEGFLSEDQDCSQCICDAVLTFDDKPYCEECIILKFWDGIITDTILQTWNGSSDERQLLDNAEVEVLVDADDVFEGFRVSVREEIFAVTVEEIRKYKGDSA